MSNFLEPLLPLIQEVRGTAEAVATERHRRERLKTAMLRDQGYMTFIGKDELRRLESAHTAATTALVDAICDDPVTTTEDNHAG